MIIYLDARYCEELQLTEKISYYYHQQQQHSKQTLQNFEIQKQMWTDFYIGKPYLFGNLQTTL